MISIVPRPQTGHWVSDAASFTTSYSWRLETQRNRSSCPPPSLRRDPEEPGEASTRAAGYSTENQWIAYRSQAPCLGFG
jgi:hypothetical protein